MSYDAGSERAGVQIRHGLEAIARAIVIAAKIKANSRHHLSKPYHEIQTDPTRS